MMSKPQGPKREQWNLRTCVSELSLQKGLALLKPYQMLLTFRMRPALFKIDFDYAQRMNRDFVNAICSEFQGAKVSDPWADMNK